MNKEIKARWVAALRSGVYTQTLNALHNEKGYCCLGVLCDLHAKETNTPWVPDAFSFLYVHEINVLPTIVRKWAGLKHQDPTVKVDGAHEALSNINDIQRKTFVEIADAIEKGL